MPLDVDVGALVPWVPWVRLVPLVPLVPQLEQDLPWLPGASGSMGAPNPVEGQRPVDMPQSEKMGTGMANIFTNNIEISLF